MTSIHGTGAPEKDDKTTAELRLIRIELMALRKLFDAFAGAFLNTRFPYGQPTDRWGRR